MEPEVEARFERIESILHAMAERENRMEIRFDKQHAQAMQRMDRVQERQKKADARFEEHQKRFEEHQKIADRKMEATRKLVEMGMRMMLQLRQQQKATQVELRDLAKSQKAFLDSLRLGGNGNGHKR